MTDPTTITSARLRDAYLVLGLDPDRWSDTIEFHVTDGGVRVERIFRDGDTPGPLPLTLGETQRSMVLVRVAS